MLELILMGAFTEVLAIFTIKGIDHMLAHVITFISNH